SLCINQAHSTLGDDSLDILGAQLKLLTHLDFINTAITDVGIEQLCSRVHTCERLAHLNLSMSSRIGNHALACVVRSLLNLRALVLTSCFGISNLKLLENLRHLRYLNLNNTSIVKEIIDEMALVMPWCEVEFGHPKVLKQKNNWTINGSRNSVCSF